MKFLHFRQTDWQGDNASSVVDPYNFDLDPNPWIRIGGKRIRLWIWPRPKIGENSNFFLNYLNYDFFLLFFSLLFIYVY